MVHSYAQIYAHTLWVTLRSIVRETEMLNVMRSDRGSAHLFIFFGNHTTARLFVRSGGWNHLFVLKHYYMIAPLSLAVGFHAICSPLTSKRCEFWELGFMMPFTL